LCSIFAISGLNKRDLGRQREDRILVAEGKILHETSHEQVGTRRVTNQLGGFQFVVWRTLKKQGLHPRSSGSKTRRFNFHVLFYAFNHNYSLFTLLFSE
jgi:hypothetical protein